VPTFSLASVHSEGVIAPRPYRTRRRDTGILHPRDDENGASRIPRYDFDRVLRNDDLVASDNCYFSATAITDGDFLRGVRFHDFGPPRNLSSYDHARARCAPLRRSTVTTNYKSSLPPASDNKRLLLD